MSSARHEVLERIRRALGADERGHGNDIRPGEDRSGFSVPREYRRRGTKGPRELLRLLHDRIVDYEATVLRCRPPELARAIAERLAARDARKLVTPPDIPDAWMRECSRAGLEVLRDLAPGVLSNAQLAACHAVLTGCVLAIGETGTLVLDGGATQGRRALTLLPDYHLCVVFQHQVVETVPEAMEALWNTVRETRPPLTLISGPSATSDIELVRVEGVHGPRTLDVILVEDP